VQRRWPSDPRYYEHAFDLWVRKQGSSPASNETIRSFYAIGATFQDFYNDGRGDDGRSKFRDRDNGVWWLYCDFLQSSQNLIVATMATARSPQQQRAAENVDETTKAAGIFQEAEIGEEETDDLATGIESVSGDSEDAEGGSNMSHYITSYDGLFAGNDSYEIIEQQTMILRPQAISAIGSISLNQYGKWAQHVWRFSVVVDGAHLSFDFHDLDEAKYAYDAIVAYATGE